MRQPAHATGLHDAEDQLVALPSMAMLLVCALMRTAASRLSGDLRSSATRSGRACHTVRRINGRYIEGLRQEPLCGGDPECRFPRGEDLPF